MKKKINLWIRILIAVVVFAAIGIAFYESSDMMGLKPYDPASPTQDKFSSLAKFISPGNDFFAVVDAWRVRETGKEPVEFIGEMGSLGGLTNDFTSALFSPGDPVGMFAVVGMIGATQEEFKTALILQGTFDEAKQVEAIRSILSADGETLGEENFEGKKLYVENVKEGALPYAFVFLDKRHIAVGSLPSLKALFAGIPFGSTVEVDKTNTLPVLFGKMKVADRIRNAMPKELSNVNEIVFSSPDAVKIVASLACEDEEKAKATRMFLEGMKSLMMLKGETRSVAGPLGKVKISSEGNEVFIEMNISDL